MGYQSGYSSQGAYSVGIGYQSSRSVQGSYAIGIGHSAANTNQGNYSVAIGNEAAEIRQGPNSVAIGNYAGFTGQGSNSIAIGNSAGYTAQPNNTIILNASGAGFSPSGNTSAFYVNPIRSVPGSTGPYLYYNTSTSEIFSSTAKSFIIDHPLNKNKYLVHACLEGPEAGVYYRGSIDITLQNINLPIEVVLADYVSVLAREYTVHATPIITELPYPNVAATRVINGRFNIFASVPCTVDYVVFGKRESINVEPHKSSVNVKGDGPYKYTSTF